MHYIISFKKTIKGYLNEKFVISNLNAVLVYHKFQDKKKNLESLHLFLWQTNRERYLFIYISRKILYLEFYSWAFSRSIPNMEKGVS